MISGTKISQLSVVTNLQDTDYFPLQRGATTNRISGLTVNTAALNTVKAAFPFNYSSNTFTLSSNTIFLSANNINLKTDSLNVSGNQVIESNNTSTALRVTQTGSGNALVIEDSTNPDTTPFAINQFGQVFLGTLSAWNGLAGLQITSDTTSSVPNAVLALKRNSNDTASTRLIFYKGRGTHSTPLELSENDNFGDISFFGYSPESGTGSVPRYRSAAQIVVQADGTPVSSLSSNPSRIMFSTTLSGDSSVTERLRITHDGKVGIGTTVPNELLTVSGNISANTVYANLFGNAETTSKWVTPRQIALTGNILGNTTIDGSQNVTIFTTISTGVIIDSNIANNANISDVKLGPITTDKKVSPTAIDYTGSQPYQVLVSTGSATVWQTLSSSQITQLSGSVTSSMLQHEAVTTDKIANQSITIDKIADNTISSIKLLASSVTTTQIANSAITTDKIDAFAVTTEKITDQAVSTDKISDGAVTSDKLATNSVISSKIVNNAITTDKILGGAVTPPKAYAFASSVPDSFVLRDSLGNLSAEEITANLKGNAQTASAWLNPLTLILSGKATGATTFNGSVSTVVISTDVQLDIPQQPPAPLWVVYKADEVNLLSATYTQGTSSEASDLLHVTQISSIILPRQELGTFTQTGSTISVVISTVKFVEDYNETYFEYNLLSGTPLTAIFTNSPVLPLSGTYIISNAIGSLSSTIIELSSSISQTITSGDAFIVYDEMIKNFPHGLQYNHIVNAIFTTAIPLSGNSATVPTSGIYRVLSASPTSNSFILSSTTNFQSASGELFLYRCTVRENYGIPNVTYLDVGRHVLNFKYPFNSTDISNFHVAFVGSGVHPTLSAGPYMTSIEKPFFGFQDPEHLEVRTILNDGTLKYYDFNRTNVICLGNRPG